MNAIELLDAYAEEIGALTPYRRGATAPKMYDALRRVLERHRADHLGYCAECAVTKTATSAPVHYPCATVQDINEALEESA